MSSDRPAEGVRDERGDAIEAYLWGAVFAFTLALFAYEFVLGVFEAEEEGLAPIATIVDFKQAMFLAALIGGGGVVALVIYAIVRYSSGIRAVPARLNPGQGSFKLTMFTLAVTAIMATTIFQGAAVLAQTDEATPQEAAVQHGIDSQLHVNVIAGQWFWRFDVDGVPYVQGEQVVVPADTLIVFETTSADVIHSFSIKELGITKDAIPGETNRAWFSVGHVEGEDTLRYTAEDGSAETLPADAYEVRCAELCGKGHSKMIATVYVVSPEDYEHWANDVNGTVATEPTGVGGDGGHDDGGHDEEEGH